MFSVSFYVLKLSFPYLTLLSVFSMDNFIEDYNSRVQEWTLFPDIPNYRVFHLIISRYFLLFILLELPLPRDEISGRIFQFTSVNATLLQVVLTLIHMNIIICYLLCSLEKCTALIVFT